MRLSLYIIVTFGTSFFAYSQAKKEVFNIFESKIIATQFDTFESNNYLKRFSVCRTNKNLFVFYPKAQIKLQLYNSNLKTMDSFEIKDYVYQNFNEIFDIDYYDDSTLFLYLSNKSHFQVDSHILMLNTNTKKVSVFNFENDTNFISYINYPTLEKAFERYNKFNYYDLFCHGWNTFLSKNRDFIIVPIKYIGLIKDSNVTMNGNVLLKLYLKSSNKPKEFFSLKRSNFHLNYSSYYNLGSFQTSLFSSVNYNDSWFVVGSKTSSNIFKVNAYTKECVSVKINYPFLSSKHRWGKGNNEQNSVYFSDNPINITKNTIFLDISFQTKLNETLNTQAMYDRISLNFLGITTPFNPINALYKYNKIPNTFNYTLKEELLGKTYFNSIVTEFNFNKPIKYTANELYNMPLRNLDINYKNMMQELIKLNVMADTVMFFRLESGCQTCVNKVKQYFLNVKENISLTKKVVIYSNSAANIAQITKFATNKNVYYTSSSSFIYPFPNSDYSCIAFNQITKTHAFIPLTDLKVALNSISPQVQLSGNQCFVKKVE